MRFFMGLAAVLLASTCAAAPVPSQPGSGDIIPPTRLSTETVTAHSESSTPWEIRWILHPVKRGMIVTLPIIDTDPNRGITMGFLPIAVIKQSSGTRIEQIHAPSITYNAIFLWTPTYRYYYYPKPTATFLARAEVSKYDHEAMGEYNDRDLLDTNLDFMGRIQYNIDPAARFYGFGPDSSKSAQANYRGDYFLYTATIGRPLVEEKPYRIHLTDRLLGERIANGPVPGLPSFDSLYGLLMPVHYQQTNEVRVTLDYDTRNHPTATRTGALVQAFYSVSDRDFASEYNYSRYGWDTRFYHPWESDDRWVTAGQFSYEQMLGSAPFWLEPSLGGKYTLRAYGEGRFVDRGMMFANLEERYTFYKKKLAGVTTEFEVAPFVGMGEVFDNPEIATARYARPVVGGAIRAVARPQVVGSVDFGEGQEGLAVFMDINYSF